MKTKQLVLGTLAGGVILYAVHSAAWMAFPWVNGNIHDLRQSEAIEAISAHTDVLPGTYYLNANEAHDGVGPELWGWMTIHRPEAYSLGKSLIGAFALNLAFAFVTAWILLSVAGGYWRRVAIAGAVGLAALPAGVLYFWAFSWFSGPYALAMTGNHLLAHGSMALALGKLVPGVSEQRSVSAAAGEAA